MGSDCLTASQVSSLVNQVSDSYPLISILASKGGFKLPLSRSPSVH